MTITSGEITIRRGATVQFATNFYDVNGELTQPPGAFVNIRPAICGADDAIQVAMDPPAGAETRWIALWDTRGVEPGMIYWSIHSTGGAIPYAVEDGRFPLAANLANLPTF